jgi:hypothetical protein
MLTGGDVDDGAASCEGVPRVACSFGGFLRLAFASDAVGFFVQFFVCVRNDAVSCVGFFGGVAGAGVVGRVIEFTAGRYGESGRRDIRRRLALTLARID